MREFDENFIESDTYEKNTRLPRRKRMKQLLDTAVQMFNQNGYQGTSMEDLAKAANITRPIIYRHFGNKDGIYLACVQRARQKLDYALLHPNRTAQKDNVAEQRLYDGVNAYFEFVEENSGDWKILFAGGAAIAGTAAEKAAHLRYATVRHLISLIKDLTPNTPDHVVEQYSHLISGSGEQLAKWWQANPEYDREYVVNTLCNFILNGISHLLRLEPSTQDNTPSINTTL